MTKFYISILILFLTIPIVSKTETIELHIENHIDKLNSESILATYRDSKGYLWVATYMGLFRSDGTNYIFYEHIPHIKNSLSAPNVFAIFEDSKNNLWIGTQKGLNQYHYETDNFTLHIPTLNDSAWIYKGIRDIAEDNEGNLWLATYNHFGLIKYNPNTRTDTTFWFPDVDEHRLNKVVFDGEYLWVGCELAGLFRFNTKTNESINIFNRNQFNMPVTINDIKSIDSILWIGTWYNGLVSYNKNNKEIIWHTPIESEQAFKPLNNVRQIAIDNNKNLWLAIYEGGFKKLNPNTGKYTTVTNVADKNDNASRYRSWFISIDHDNILWMGTLETGLKKAYLNTANSNYLYYTKNGKKARIKQVTNAISDDKNNIWIGTHSQGLFKHNSKANKTVKINLGDHDIHIIKLTQDSLKRIWASTDQGIFVINSLTNTVIYNLAEVNNYFNQTIKTPFFLYTDRDGDIWMSAWQSGLIRLKNDQLKNNAKSYTPIRYMADENNDLSIHDNNIINTYQDKNGVIWVSGTYFIQKFDKTKNTFKLIDWIDATNIAEDCEGNLWISSNNLGLTKYIPNKNSFDFFSNDFKGQANGVGIFSDSCSIWFPRKNELIKFNYALDKTDKFNNISGIKIMNHSNSCLKTNDGRIFLGGDKGCYFYEPNYTSNSAQIYASKLFIHNNQVMANDTVYGKVILTKSINQTKKLTIPAGIKSFSIELSAINFVDPKKSIYAYKIDGFDTTWHMLEYPNKLAVLNNLNGGDYKFHYALYNPFIDWEQQIETIEIKVLTPYYKTLWFKGILVLVTVVLIILFFLIRQQRLNMINIELEHQVSIRTQELQQSNEELKTQTEQLNIANSNLIEKQEFINEQNEEINQQKNELQKNNELLIEMNSNKDKFFSIIAHDLKSPIASIMGLLDLINEGYDTFTGEQLKNMIQESFNSSQNVYILVENLLYWARSISDKVEFNPKITNLNQIIQNNIKVLLLPSREKNITINFKETPNELVCNVDNDMINFIVRNLISNAIKFTHIDGQISIKAQQMSNQILVSIQDNGVGIPADKIDTIFRINNETSTRGTNNEKGTGLGLVLCKDFIERHNGKIWIDSEVNKGSTVFFSIPQ